MDCYAVPGDQEPVMENTNLTSISDSLKYYKQLETHLLDTVSRSEIRPYALELFAQEENNCSPFKITFRQLRPGAESCSLPIRYQRKQIGSLVLSNQQRESCDRRQVNQLTQRIAYLVSRYQVGELSEQYLGRKFTLSGQSPAILDVELFIEKASCALCPINIMGENGTNKLAVAIAIHFNSRFKHGAFTEIDCSNINIADFRYQLETQSEDNERGSLFLNGIEMLNNEQQSILLETIATPFKYNINPKKRFNLIAASSKNLTELVIQGKFSSRLREEFSYLEVSLPSLRERAQDIPILVKLLLNRFRLFEEQSLSYEVIDILQNYHWPGNEMQLERAVARLLTLSDNNPVNINDLSQYLPQLMATQDNKCIRAKGKAQNLTQHMLDNELSLYSGMHTGLYKALKYIADNYEREITLSELAKNVYVSASHLSYLFKHHLHKSFKQILSELRIERAKQKITETPYARITDISQEAGFGDLSHFEKIFKRYTGVTPREYKKKIQEIYKS